VNIKLIKIQFTASLAEGANQRLPERIAILGDGAYSTADIKGVDVIIPTFKYENGDRFSVSFYSSYVLFYQFGIYDYISI
jgi:hypothetical protein